MAVFPRHEKKEEVVFFGDMIPVVTAVVVSGRRDISPHSFRWGDERWALMAARPAHIEPTKAHQLWLPSFLIWRHRQTFFFLYTGPKDNWTEGRRTFLDKFSLAACARHQVLLILFSAYCPRVVVCGYCNIGKSDRQWTTCHLPKGRRAMAGRLLITKSSYRSRCSARLRARTCHTVE